MINYQNILISIQIKLNFIRFKNNISLKKKKKKRNKYHNLVSRLPNFYYIKISQKKKEENKLFARLKEQSIELAVDRSNTFARLKFKTIVRYIHVISTDRRPRQGRRI